MSRFAEVLSRTADRLAVPQPAKSRILLEIAGDMDDLHTYHLERGLTEDLAVEKTIGQLDLSDDALDDLVALHTSRVRRVLDGLSGRGRARVERIALGLLLVFVVSVSWIQVSGVGVFEHVGGAAWDISALTLVAMVIVGRKAWMLWVVQNHDIRSLHRWLPELLYAGIANVVVGSLGVWLQLRSMVESAASRLASGGDAGPHVAAAAGYEVAVGLRGVAATATLAMLWALLCVLAWWVLARKVAAIEQAEVEFLIDG